MLELFDLVDVGAVVEITYQPVMLARYGDGTVFLEVHPDPYRLSGRPEAQVRDLLRTVGSSTWPARPPCVRPSRSGPGERS
jgi:hypothetical protein